MCTIIIVSRILEETPLLLAANRDEDLSRPAAPPALLDDRNPKVVAPRDLQAGGTWLGINAHGLLAAITNRFDGPRDATRRSRGELVFEALEHATPGAAAEAIAAHDAGDYNGFHLTLSSVEDVRVVWSDGATMKQVTYGPGVHVFTERSFRDEVTPRVAFLRERVEALRAAGELDVPHLQDLLSIHRPGDVDATCVRIPEMNYGTRSSTIVDPARPLLLHAEGAPCEVAYEDRSALLHALL